MTATWVVATGRTEHEEGNEADGCRPTHPFARKPDHTSPPTWLLRAYPPPVPYLLALPAIHFIYSYSTSLLFYPDVLLLFVYTCSPIR